jgi:nitrogen fixation/metabolism regulation signal transduction histidine kinase
MSEASAPAAASGRHQRKLKNYLLDKQFQLKYTGYLVAIALVLSVALGLVLWRVSREVLSQSHATVHQGEQVVDLGQVVVKESRKVSEVVRMNIVKDPVYADNPALREAFETDARTQDDRLKKQQEQLESQAASLKAQSQNIAHQQTVMFSTLAAVLLLLVLGIGVAGIVVTHRIAGPIFKMKRQIREVGEGKLKIPGKLRKGDELVDFFDTFHDMVVSLREHQEKEITALDAALEKIEGKADAKDLEPLKQLRADMQAALDAK